MIENIMYSFLELIPRAFNIRLRYVWVVQNNHGTPFEVAFHPKDNMDTLKGLITHTLSQHGRPSIAVDKIYSPTADGHMHCDVVIEGFELITNHIEENSYSRPFWFTISERLSSSEMIAWVQQEGYAPFQVLIRSSDLIDDLKESIAVTLYRRGRTGHSEVWNVYMPDANGHMNYTGLIAVDDLVRKYMEKNSANYPLWFTITQAVPQPIVVVRNQKRSEGSRTLSTSSDTHNFQLLLPETSSFH